MSAPACLAIKVLDNCQARLAELSIRVEGLSVTCRDQTAEKFQDSLACEVLKIHGGFRSRSLTNIKDCQNFESVMADTGVEKLKAKKPSRCHQCHTPLEEAVHAGVKCGVGVCPLPHWKDCDGNIPEDEEAKAKVWAPCPESESEDDDSGDIKLSDDSLDDDDSEVIIKDGKLTVESAAAAMEDAIQNQNFNPNLISESGLLGAGSDVFSVQSGSADGRKQTLPSRSDSSSSSDGELNARQQELTKLKMELLRQQQAKAAADLSERADRKEQKKLVREKKAAELERQAQLLKEQLKQTKPVTKKISKLTKSPATIGFKETRVSASKSSGVQGAVTSKKGLTAAQNRDLPSEDSVAGGEQSLEEQVAVHEARRQRKTAEKLVQKQKQQAAGLTIAGIRKMPDVQEQALEMMARLQEIIPTLAKAPSAAAVSGVNIQPPGVFNTRKNDVLDLDCELTGNEQRFVYVASLGRTIPVVDTPDDIPRITTSKPQVPVDSSDDECSEDEECPFSAETGKRFAWRRNQDGSKYFELVDIQVPVSRDLVKTYVLNKSTSRYECKYLPASLLGEKEKRAKADSSRDKKTPYSPLYKDHRVTTSSTGGFRNQPRVLERQATYVSSELQADKQGKESRVPELVQYARDCPVSWTSKVTTDKLNPILWSWAYISQVLATRTGHAPVLDDGELEARLQHFLSVLEVTLQTTTQSDFCSDSWKVSRLYHSKVQQKIDNGEHTWVQVLHQWGAATLPHELMAAKAEIQLDAVKPKQPVVPAGGREKNTDGKGKSRDLIDPEKLPCNTWNNSETQGKCSWEVDHEGETCNRIHACSWCKFKRFRPTTHQKRFCRKRLEQDEE